jgi:phosphoenolpyruvate carboxykinase (GTP)
MCGSLRSTEAGFFGVAPGTSARSNPKPSRRPGAIHLHQRGPDGQTGDVWWEDMTDEPHRAVQLDGRGLDAASAKKARTPMPVSPRRQRSAR